MASANKPPHKAKPTHKGRKYGRNFPGHTRSGHPDSKYVIRMKQRGTYRTRKGIQRKVSA